MLHREQVISLYHDGFPEDSDAFRDYFVDHIASDEGVVTASTDGVMTSIAHIVPKSLRYHDNIVDISYLVAVSTLTPYRGQGRIREVMREALDRIEERHEPFVMLYPFSHEYYTQYGFTTIDCESAIDRLSMLDCEKRACDDIDRLYEIYDAYERAHDACIHRERSDMANRVHMLYIDDGVCYTLHRGDECIGYAMAYGDKIEELVALDDTILGDRRVPNVMARLVDIPAAFRLIAFDKGTHCDVVLHVVDAFRRDRYVRLNVTDGAVRAQYLERNTYSIPTIDITIEDATHYVLGTRDIDGLPQHESSAIHMIDKY